jgi:RNA polymerase sigma-70 factor (ECF subfamily)
LGLSDKELAGRILSGDEGAFQELYQAHQKALIRACWYFLGNDSEVEDMVQETFIKALKNLSRFRFECSLGTWLNHIAVNLCRDWLEKRKKNMPLDVDFFAQLPSREQPKAYPEEALRLIQQEIGQLEGRDKDLIILRMTDKLSYEAIANRLNIPVGSVTSGIYRARQHLIEKVRAKLPELKEGKTP